MTTVANVQMGVGGDHFACVPIAQPDHACFVWGYSGADRKAQRQQVECSGTAPVLAVL